MAIKQHTVAAFTLPGASMGTWYKLTYLVKAYPKIMTIIEGNKPPYFYRVHPSIRIERLTLP